MKCRVIKCPVINCPSDYVSVINCRVINCRVIKCPYTMSIGSIDKLGFLRYMGPHTRTAVACLPLRQLGFLVYIVVSLFKQDILFFPCAQLYRVGQKTGPFLRVDNFATVSDRKAYYISKVCQFYLE